jgi:hypothetical protein
VREVDLRKGTRLVIVDDHTPVNNDEWVWVRTEDGKAGMEITNGFLCNSSVADD